MLGFLVYSWVFRLEMRDPRLRTGVQGIALKTILQDHEVAPGSLNLGPPLARLCLSFSVSVFGMSSNTKERVIDHAREGQAHIAFPRTGPPTSTASLKCELYESGLSGSVACFASCELGKSFFP